MKKFLLFVVVAAFSGCLMAQDSKVDIFAGYQYLHNGNVDVNGETEPGTSQGYNGWDVAPAFNFSKFLGVQADISGTYATVNGVSTHVYTYTGGPLVFVGLGPFKPYAHVLVGGARLSAGESSVSVSTNGYTVMFGGGLDVKASRLLAIRLGQVDWLYYHFSGFSGNNFTSPSFSGASNFRFSTGLVLRF